MLPIVFLYRSTLIQALDREQDVLEREAATVASYEEVLKKLNNAIITMYGLNIDSIMPPPDDPDDGTVH